LPTYTLHLNPCIYFLYRSPKNNGDRNNRHKVQEVKTEITVTDNRNNEETLNTVTENFGQHHKISTEFTGITH